MGGVLELFSLLDIINRLNICQGARGPIKSSKLCEIPGHNQKRNIKFFTIANIIDNPAFFDCPRRHTSFGFCFSRLPGSTAPSMMDPIRVSLPGSIGLVAQD